MTIGITDSKNYQDIAEAIREKTGKTEQLSPADMAGEIQGIQTGGGENYLATLLNGKLTELTDRETGMATTIPNYAFYKCSTLTSVDLPAATSIGSYAFSGCSTIESIDLPSATSIGGSAFYGCNIESIDLPNATSLGYNLLGNCTRLKTINIPEVTSVGQCFTGCSSLAYIELPKVEKVTAEILQDVGGFNCPTCISLPSLTSCTSKLKTTTSGYAAEVNAPLLETIPDSFVIWGSDARADKIPFIHFESAKTIGKYIAYYALRQRHADDYSDAITVYLPKAESITAPMFYQQSATGGENYFYIYMYIGTESDKVATLSGQLMTSTGASQLRPFIYVPDALVEDYKNATNWSLYADYIFPVSEAPELRKSYFDMREEATA